jgi:hypothetical protein
VTLTLEFPDHLTAALQASAAAQGLSIEALLAQILEQHVARESFAHLQQTDPAEWARRFHPWAESHDRTTPLLSDEAISRASIYPDRF